jgi:hypothetical protein
MPYICKSSNIWHKHNHIELIFIILTNMGTLQNADKATHYLKLEDDVFLLTSSGITQNGIGADSG